MSGEGNSLDRKVLALDATFDSLVSSKAPPKRAHRGTFDLATTYDDIFDARERYKLWSGSLGASLPENDERSLLYRLRDAPSVQDRIVEILDELEHLIEKLINPESSAPATHSSLDEEGESDDDLLTELRQISTSSDTHSTWVLRSVCDAVTRLFKMSRLLSMSTATDRYARAQARRDVRFDDSFDIARMREKFRGSSAEDWLIQRLGKANTSRREYFRYCREHLERVHSRSSRPMEETIERKQDGGSSAPGDNARKTEESNAVATTVGGSEHRTKAFTVVPDLAAEVDGDFDDISISSKATSIGADDACDQIRFPSLNSFAGPGTYFECPYCRETQRFNGQAGFKKHVVKDLRPFVCTFDDCGTLMFDNRQTWVDHEMKEHRRHWSCPESACKAQIFPTRAHLASHLRTRHSKTFTGGSVDLILETSSRPLADIEARACRLCDWESHLRTRNRHVPYDVPITVPARRFMKHLGHHLEQIALFALPRPIPANESSMFAELDDDSSVNESYKYFENHEFETLPALAVLAWTVIFATRWRAKWRTHTTLHMSQRTSSDVHNWEQQPVDFMEKAPPIHGVSATSRDVEVRFSQMLQEVITENPKGPAVQIDEAGMERARASLRKLWNPVHQLSKTYRATLKVGVDEQRVKDCMRAREIVSQNALDGSGQIKDYLSVTPDELLGLERLVSSYMLEMKNRTEHFRAQERAAKGSAPSRAQDNAAGMPQGSHGTSSSNATATGKGINDLFSRRPDGVPQYGSARAELTVDDLKLPHPKKNETNAPVLTPNSTLLDATSLPALLDANEPSTGGVEDRHIGGLEDGQVSKHPATFQCNLCPKRFTRAYNLRFHLRTHTDVRPFVCTVCGKAFARQQDRKRHESLHSEEKKFVCYGQWEDGTQWGCHKGFARANGFVRHLRTEAGRSCIEHLLKDTAQRPEGSETGNFLPLAVLAQYPMLANMNWDNVLDDPLHFADDLPQFADDPLQFARDPLHVADGPLQFADDEL